MPKNIEKRIKLCYTAYIVCWTYMIPRRVYTWKYGFNFSKKASSATEKREISSITPSSILSRWSSWRQVSSCSIDTVTPCGNGSMRKTSALSLLLWWPNTCCMARSDLRERTARPPYLLFPLRWSLLSFFSPFKRSGNGSTKAGLHFWACLNLSLYPLKF